MSDEEFENLKVGDRLTNIAALNGVVITHRLEDDEGHISYAGVLPVLVDNPKQWAKIEPRSD